MGVSDCGKLNKPEDERGNDRELVEDSSHSAFVVRAGYGVKMAGKPR